MDTVFYPNLYLNDEVLIKTLSFFWESVKTIIPPSQKEIIKEINAGNSKITSFYPSELYKKVNGELGTNFLDFIVFNNKERLSASEKMFNLVSEWNKDSKLYDSLKINKFEDLFNKVLEWQWFLHEKFENPLVELLLQEKLLVNWAPGEIVCHPEVGEAYMSVICNEIKNNRSVRLITNKEFASISKTGVNTIKSSYGQNLEEGYQLISLAIPDVFIDPKAIQLLSWKNIHQIRQDLMPLRLTFYNEIEKYQTEINKLYKDGHHEEAFDKFCEFCEKVALSFKPIHNEIRRVLGKIRSEKTQSLLNGILFPIIKLINANQEINNFFEIATVTMSSISYSYNSREVLSGFDYLQNLNRKIKRKALMNALTIMVPKSIKSIIPKRNSNF